MAKKQQSTEPDEFFGRSDNESESSEEILLPPTLVQPTTQDKVVEVRPKFNDTLVVRKVVKKTEEE